MPVDEHTRADLRRRVDVRDEIPAHWQLARVVMVEIFDRDVVREQRGERLAIHVERNVEHCERVAGLGGHALDECDVALRAGDERRLARPCEPQLMERADAVCVAVEYVEMRHVAEIPLG